MDMKVINPINANVFSWLGEKATSSLGWLGEKTFVGLLDVTGDLCNYITDYCTGFFIIFAIIGAIIYTCGGDVSGMALIRKTLWLYLIILLMGVIL